MLLTLLPLVGWAEAPTVSLSKTQYTYIGGSMATAVEAKLTITGDYDQVRFYAAGGTSDVPEAPAATVAGVTPVNVGGYYVRAAYGDDWSDPVYFRIMPKDLELTATQVEVGYGNYSVIAGGADIPSGYYTVSGFVGSDDIYDVNITGVKGSSAAADAANGAAGSYPYNLSIANASSGNPNYSLKVIGTGSTLTITPAPLTITTENKTKIYGNVDPEFTATYVGFVNGEDASVLTDLEITRVAGEDVGTYAISVTATSSNYEITPVNSGLLTISQRSIDADNLAITGVDPNGYTYTGQPIQPTFVVKDMSLGEEGTALVAGTDYTVTWYQNTNAGTGQTDESPRFKIKPVAGSNFTFANTNKYFTINKAPLTLSTVAKEKTYGAVDPTFEVAGTGFVNNETVAVLTSLTFERETGEGVGTYVISVATVDAANYEITLDAQNNGSLTINKATLNAQVKNQNIVFGAAIPNNEIVYVDGLAGTDVFADVVNLTNVAYSYEQGGQALTEDPANAGVYTIKATGATADNYDVVVADGALTIGQGALYLKPVAKSKVYGTNDPASFTEYKVYSDAGATTEVTGVTPNGTVTITRANAALDLPGDYNLNLVYTPDTQNPDNYEFTPVVSTFTIQKAPLIVKISEANEKVYGEDDPTYDYDVVGLVNDDTKAGAATITFTRVAGNDVVAGGYEVSIASFTSTKYELDTEKSTNGKLTITARPIAVVVKPQTIDYGADIEKTSTLGTYWIFATAGWNGNTADTKADLNLVLSTINAIGTYAPGSTTANAIKATISNTNYVLTNTAEQWGALTVNDVTATTELVMRSSYEDTNDDEFTKIQAYDGKNVHVKIIVNRTQTVANSTLEYTWKGEEWNAFILPFAITPKELSEIFGYAIVNVVNPGATTAGNVAFKLNMSESIPANTPFMLKNYQAVAEDAEIDFGTREIEAPASAEVSVAAGAGIQFIGSYQTKKLDNTMTNSYFYNGEGAWKHFGASSDKSWYVAPFNAYMEMPTAASAREITFTFEEIDGSATVIKSVSEESTDTVLEGWYTLNGMKLESAPTQKGIYIFNGKKVVIK